jgi:hypothetical protein
MGMGDRPSPHRNWGLPGWQRHCTRCHLPNLSLFRLILLYSDRALDGLFTSQDPNGHHGSECSG